MPTCLVTGGAGFLGSHLCDELLRRGNRVICVDSLETGSLANIEHIRTDDFVHLNLDIIEPYFVDEPIDFVYHLASPASPIDYLRLPLHTLKVGSYGTHHTLGLAKKHRARFLIASTSEVYGDPQVHPQPETYWGHVNPIGPRGVYDEAKRYAEALTMAYHRQQGVDTVDRPHLQHVRTEDAAPRRSGDPHIPAPGAPGSADHGVRRRIPDAVVLLRRGRDPGADHARRVGSPRSGQHRQPGRVHAARAGQDGDRGHRIPVGDRLRGAARPTTRRSASPTSRSRARSLGGSRRSPFARDWRRRLNSLGPRR